MTGLKKVDVRGDEQSVSTPREGNPTNVEIARILEKIAQNGLAFTDLSIADVQKGYAKRAKTYSAEIKESPHKPHLLDMTNRFLLDTFEKYLKGKNITYLDAGCADGVRTNEIKEKLNTFCTVDRLIAFDYTPEMVRVAKKLLGEEAAEWGDLTATDFTYKNFDLVTSLYATLGHIPDHLIPKALENLHDSLKPGGIAGIDVIGRDEDFLQRFKYGEDSGNEGKNVVYLVNPGENPLRKNGPEPILFTQRLFGTDEMETYVRNAGFSVLEAKELRSDIPRIKFRMGMEYAMVLLRDD
jgi:SAM-dependent methyltransferase